MEPSSPSTAGSIQPRVAMIQGSARLHYALPVSLKRAGILEKMFADFYVAPSSIAARMVRLIALFNAKKGRRLMGRRARELDGCIIEQNPWLSMREYLARARSARVGGGRGLVPTAHWIRTAQREGRWIRRRGLGKANALMGFITSIDPEMLQSFREQGIVTVGDQIGAPIAIAVEEARKQQQRFPGWETPAALQELQGFDEFVRRTWDALDHITCASEYVRQGLIDQGLDSSMVSMIPYPFDVRSMPYADRGHRGGGGGRTGPLTVGFVGTVNLNKGVPYFFEVARRFANRNVRFVMVGNILLNSEKVDAHRGAVELIGGVPRSDVPRWLEQFDVFFFPATCEGSSGSVIEAMASGLPVVTTPNSGTYARDGIEGLLCSYDDIDGFEQCIRRLLDDEDLRLSMGWAARQRVALFDLDHYSTRIKSLMETLLNAKRAAPKMA